VRWSIVLVAVLVGCASPAIAVRPRSSAYVAAESAIRLPTEAGDLELETVSSTSAVTDAWPAVRVGADAFLLDLRDNPTDTPTFGWRIAKVLADRRTVIGVIESVVEGPGHELHVVVSSDGGRRWIRRGTVQKPHYLAVLRALEIDDAQRFRLVVALDDCADCGVSVGTYAYETRDGGATWKDTFHARHE